VSAAITGWRVGGKGKDPRTRAAPLLLLLPHLTPSPITPLLARSKKINKGIGITSIHSLDDQLWHSPDFG
jgi:hypothetical protein